MSHPPPRSQVRRREGDLVALHRVYALSRDRRLREELLDEYDDFAVHLARKFSTRREEVEDLTQVARVGLIHALDRYDPKRERPFLAFAGVTIIGELKRHVRDHTWRLRTARSLQEHYLLVARTADDLTQELGRSPRISEVAARAGVSEDEVLEAMDVAHSVTPMSLDHPRRESDGATLDPAVADPGFDRVEDHQMVTKLIARLPPREQRIMHLRFEHELSQAEIAARVGVSQMCISRILGRTLHRMRAQLSIEAQAPNPRDTTIEMPPTVEEDTRTTMEAAG
ncbi:MAG TPA: sigma-70 family RNA polymerase sigma factor [Actinomycetota bacterium]|nr:sigma-70 family RNA polymerase sigma factor [Actinomycetota bacterium]